MITTGKQRILIVSPHADDEILGCGGLIEKSCRYGNEVKVVVMAVGTIQHRHNVEPVVATTRKQELQAALAYLGCKQFEIVYTDKDSLLDTIPRKEIVSKLDALLQDFSPTMVFIPLPSYHQDHIVLYEACIAALRPNPDRLVNVIAMYEYPFVTWQFDKFWHTGELYLDLTDTIDKKITAFQMHQSQLRPNNHLLSPTSVREFARFRGLEVGLAYAEKYYLLRAHLL